MLVSFSFNIVQIETKNFTTYKPFDNIGYIPSAFVIPGTEIGPTGTFLASGGFSISNGYDSSCADSFATTSAAVDTCIVDGLFSYKLQLVKGMTLPSDHFFLIDVTNLQ